MLFFANIFLRTDRLHRGGVFARFDKIHHLIEQRLIRQHVGHAADHSRRRRNHGGIHGQAAVLEAHRKVDDLRCRQVGRHALCRALDNARQFVHWRLENLVDKGFHQQTLVRRARKIAVGIRATASKRERRFAVERLQAFLDNDVASIRVVDKLRNVHLYAADRVNKLDELFEVHFRIVGNLHAAQLVCFYDSGRSATVRIRCVELLHVPIDFDHGVTGDRDHGDDVFDRIYIDQDVRVGALAARRVVRARVRSDEQHVERLVEVRVRVRHLSDGVTLLFGQTATERFVDFAEVPGTCDACAYQAYKQHAHDADRDFLAA